MNENIKTIQVALGLTADGKRGPVTTAAILEAADNGRLIVKPAASVTPQPAQVYGGFASPAYSQLTSVFGDAGGPSCTGGRVSLPFHFRLAWDTDQHVNFVSCHSKVAAAFTSIWAEAAKTYGESKFRALGLDLYGGCYNYRPMRGGSSLSTHAWGIAWDVDPERNQLKWDHNTAVLARSEYVPFWNIVEGHGAISLGRSKDYDWMHFQFCK